MGGCRFISLVKMDLEFITDAALAHEMKKVTAAIFHPSPSGLIRDAHPGSHMAK